MRAIGMVRKVDELGRFVLPKELRDVQDIKEGDGLEIFVQDDLIILRKYYSGCCFCRSYDGLIRFGDKLMCKNCAAKIAETLKPVETDMDEDHISVDPALTKPGRTVFG